MKSRFFAELSGCLVLSAAVTGLSAGQVYEDNLPLDHPAIRYLQAPLDDPVSRLGRDLESGKQKLDFREGGAGYLESLLESLDLRSDSQTLVFSKTSLQRSHISPRTPRAIYFGDAVAVGFLPGSPWIELAAVDPRQGVSFYQLSNQQVALPRFLRPSVCLECHLGPATLGVPGMYVGSVSTRPSGVPDFLSSIVTDHRTPFRDRWEGWYVNGTHGAERHRGNAVAAGPAEPGALQSDGTQNLESLVTKIDPAPYLSPVSDIVALMTLEHQTQMTNLIIRLGWEARIAEHEATAGSDSRLRLSARIDELVRYMLFADEVTFRDPIRGVSTFAESFAGRGPRDRRGRSLRDFDLKTRLFRYPLSYLVYGEAFDGLPDTVREGVLKRLHEALTRPDPGGRFRLNAGDRKAVLEILRDTKPNLPSYYEAGSP